MRSTQFKKKILFTLLAAGLTTSASAHYGTHNNLAGTWFGGVQALYLQPSNDDLFYATDSVTGKNYYVHPRLRWGFEGNLGYYLCDNNDVSVNYTRFHSSRTDSVDDVFLGDITGRATFHYDEANIQIGHLFRRGAWSFHPFAGLEYLRIRRAFAVYDTPLDISPSYQKNISWYSGIGPRFGADIAFNLGYNLSLVSGGAAALLATEERESNTAIGGFARSQNRHLVTWAAETKIGLAYDTLLWCKPVSFEGGYKFYGFEGGEGGLSRATSFFKFGLAGPYFGVNVAL